MQMEDVVQIVRPMRIVLALFALLLSAWLLVAVPLLRLHLRLPLRLLAQLDAVPRGKLQTVSVVFHVPPMLNVQSDHDVIQIYRPVHPLQIHHHQSLLHLPLVVAAVDISFQMQISNSSCSPLRISLDL